jgi:hypothetical protein
MHDSHISSCHPARLGLDALNTFLKGVTYKEASGALQDYFRNQHVATACHNQLKRRTHFVGEFLQELGTSIIQMTQCTLSVLLKDHDHREASKEFINGI